MANYPQLDNARGVWNMKEVYDAVMGGYWPNALSRGIWAGGSAPSDSNVIDFVTISTTGDATDFGDLVTSQSYNAAAGNFTRSFFGGGSPAGTSIEYVTPTSQGNAADFGDLTQSKIGCAATANSTRGLVGGGGTSEVNVIQYLTIAATGNTVDFGDLTVSRFYLGANSSPTRSLFAGGQSGTGGSVSRKNTIDYVEFATTGNATDFGDIATASTGVSGHSSSTRGVFSGMTPSAVTTVEYVDIASQANAVDYADLSVARGFCGSTSNSVRGLFGHGSTPSINNVIDYHAIATGGTFIDFGDASVTRESAAATSNSHGGLNDGYQGTRITPVGAPTRALLGSGSTGPSDSEVNFIEYINISTKGDNSADFGNLSVSRRHANACASTTRACFGGGATPSISDVIDYVTIATIGNAADFGNLQAAKQETASTSNATRGIWFGGFKGGGSPHDGTDEIDYVTIDSTGNASDFGNLSAGRRNSKAATASSTRAVVGGGWISGNSDVGVNIMEYVTIGSTGNVTDFGDLTDTRWDSTAAGSSTRGIWAGGYKAPTAITTIDYITIASTGDAASFGDLHSKGTGMGATSNNVRGILCGGGTGAGGTGRNIIGYVTIASLGNENDFGDLHVGYTDIAATSANHGGLQ